MTAGSPVPDEVTVEIERVARRLHQQALDHALAHAPQVRALAQDLAALTPGPDGAAPEPVSLTDLGPATALDQLRVCIHDAAGAGVLPPDLAERVAQLRRALG